MRGHLDNIVSAGAQPAAAVPLRPPKPERARARTGISTRTRMQARGEGGECRMGCGSPVLIATNNAEEVVVLNLKMKYAVENDD